MTTKKDYQDLARYIRVRLEGPLHPDTDGHTPKLEDGYTTIPRLRLLEIASALDDAADHAD